VHNYTEEPKPIRRGVELAIVSCTLSLPTKLVEIPIVVVSIQVKAFKEPATPKPTPLVILEIGIGAKINNITHAFKVFKIPHIMFNNTHVIESPKSQLVPL
jgi:hypothetical protein